MNNNKILAVIRTSTIRQEIQSQKKDITEFCVQKGFKESNIIYVEGFGASARKRNDKYLRMLDEIQSTIEKNNIKFVAVWHLNRLGRTEENLSTLKEYFERNHIQVFIKNPSLTLFNEDGTLNNGTSMAWTIFAMMIKFDTIELMEKLSRGRQYRKEQKKFLGGSILYGYQVDEYGYYEENKEESRIVTEIFNTYSKGNTTASALKKDFIEKGYISRNTKPFTAQFISKIIRTEDYYNNKTYPAIITEDLFNKCRSISTNNNITQSKERKIHLGSKLLKCLECGHGFQHVTTNTGSYYFCIGYRFKNCHTDCNCINAHAFDYCVKHTTINIYSQILLQKNKEDISTYQKDIEEKQGRITIIKDTISKTEKKIRRINDLYINGSYLNEEDYKKDYQQQISIRNNSITRQKELENEIKSIQSQIEIIKSGNSTDISKWLTIRKELLNIEDIKELKRIVDLSIKTAYLKKVFINGKNYTAIVIVSALDNKKKSLYLYYRSNLYSVMLLGNNGITITKEDFKENSSPKLVKFPMTVEEYQQIIS